MQTKQKVQRKIIFYAYCYVKSSTRISRIHVMRYGDASTKSSKLSIFKVFIDWHFRKKETRNKVTYILMSWQQIKLDLAPNVAKLSLSFKLFIECV